MFGLSFELVMETLLKERGYKVIMADELGFDPSEMLEIAKEYSPIQFEKVVSHFGEDIVNSMSCKDVLDNFFKVDALLELPRKKGQPQVVVGLQFYNYNEYHLDNDKKISYKLKQLKHSWNACQELFISRTYVVAGFVPTIWDGLGLRTEDQNKLIKERLLNLISEVSKPHDSPQVVHISFEF